MPGRILEFQSKISHEAKSPTVKFVVLYGSNLVEERQVFEEKLAPYLSDFTVLMGDFNAITRLQDTNAVSAKAMMWQWLVEAEASCKLVDITRLACNGSPPPRGSGRMVAREVTWTGFMCRIWCYRGSRV